MIIDMPRVCNYTDFMHVPELEYFLYGNSLFQKIALFAVDRSCGCYEDEECDGEIVKNAINVKTGMLERLPHDAPTIIVGVRIVVSLLEETQKEGV